MHLNHVRAGAALPVAALCVLCCPPGIAANTPPDLGAIAEKIVTQNAGVQEGDRVVVRGDARDFDLIEEISLAVWKQGAEPIQLVGREQFIRRYYDDVPAKFDALPLKFAAMLVESQTVEITVDSEGMPNLFRDVPAERLAAAQKRFQAVADARLKRGVRTVHVGNEMFPTTAAAERLGLTLDQLSEIFWRGIDVDSARLQATGNAVQAMLAAGKELHITHANGTDLKVRVEGRPVFVSDGVITNDDIRRGGPATQVWLPAGEVYVTPVPGSAEGRVIIDSIPFPAGEIKGASFTFKAGRLVSHEAHPGPGYDRWKELYAAGTKGKDEFGLIDIGINPEVTIPDGSKFVCWVAAGIVNVGFGNNLWAGGSNDAAFGAGGALIGCTVKVDGKVLVDKGKLISM